MKAADITTGSWTARWGNWVVKLRPVAANWEVTVWRWPPESPLSDRVLITKWAGFDTNAEAVAWACAAMLADGARVMVLDSPKPITLESLLRFNPAPEAVA